MRQEMGGGVEGGVKREEKEKGRNSKPIRQAAPQDWQWRTPQRLNNSNNSNNSSSSSNNNNSKMIIPAWKWKRKGFVC